MCALAGRRRCTPLLLSLLLAATACDDPARLGGSPARLARIGLAPSLTAAAEPIYRNALIFGLELDNVRLKLERSDGSVVSDTVVGVPLEQSEIRIELVVQLRAVEERMRAHVEIRAANVAFFTGVQEIVVRANASAQGPAPVPLSYVGPDAGVTTLSIAPSTISLFTNGSVDFVATAFNASQQPVQLVAVDWAVRNAALGTVGGTGHFTPASLRGETFVVATLPTGLKDSARVSVIPLPTQIASISGGGQIGLVGALLPNPIVVELRAADNLPVPGYQVDFAITAGGGSLSTSRALTDANGRASTLVTLGLLPGANVISISAPGIAPISVTATANLLAR